MTEDEIRLDERQKIQGYIDENNIYQVEFGYYDYAERGYGQWIPLKTHRINIMEVLDNGVPNNNK